jgi:hypothetical protein
MLESDAFDSATEKCVLFFQSIKRRLQLGLDCFGLIGDDNKFEIHSFVEHLKYLQPTQFDACATLTHARLSQ